MTDPADGTGEDDTGVGDTGGGDANDGDDRTFHVDGELVPASAATVSVRDRGFMYGDGAFETMRAYGGEVFRWDAHADRLAGACETLALDHGLSAVDLRERVRATLAANDLAEAYVKLSVTRGAQPGTLTPDPEVDPTVVVQVAPLSRGGVDGDPTWDDPATVQTVTTRRIPDDCLPSDAKTHNYLNEILATLELRRARGGGLDADVALQRDLDGAVASGASSNVFVVVDDALLTPSLDGPVLPGITRETVLDIAESEGIPTRETTLSADDVRSAEEAFLTNSTWELRPVASVDGIDVGGGPLTELLGRLFDRRVEREHYG
ncbi:MAG: aminotransferase class IV [Halolamina sp.]